MQRLQPISQRLHQTTEQVGTAKQGTGARVVHDVPHFFGVQFGIHRHRTQTRHPTSQQGFKKCTPVFHAKNHPLAGAQSQAMPQRTSDLLTALRELTVGRGVATASDGP